MPHKPQPANNPDGLYNVVVQIPGWLKNKLIEHCAKLDVSLNSWLATRIFIDLQEEQGIPPAPQAANPLPTTADQIRAWATGQKLLMPCGKTDCQPQPQNIGGNYYCHECKIRIS